jgi:anthranilate synthase component 1
MSTRGVVARTLVRKLDVPASVLRHLAATDPDRYPTLFDSAAEGPLGRTSILAARPTAALWLDADGNLHAEGVEAQGNGFFDALDRWWLAERQAVSAPDLPFTGGWVVFLSYEMAQEVEPRLALPRSSLPWRAFALRVPCALIHDKATNSVLAIAEPEAAGALDELEADARRVSGQGSAPTHSQPSTPLPIPVRAIHEEPPEKYLERVRRAKEYIAAGDIYQANLSRPWRIELAGKPSVAEIYARLCTTNPAPFAALVQWRGATLLSSSPERLVRTSGGIVETRPIAGTRPRSRTPGQDVVEASELVAHPKERAEHIMLIDLERNDLGRVCEPGTVSVDELMVTETYAHVHHIVSNVRGHLRADVTPLEAVRAVFPGGTITGVPKFRCMQIIAELEGQGRGAYTGSLGFLSRDGTMDLNILIRTMTLMGNEIYLRAGGGIVADSDPPRELEETRAKARGMLAVFERAEAQAK